jgi:Proteasome subunit
MKLPRKLYVTLVVASVFVLAFWNAPAQAPATKSSHGTINILLANSNGMVLVTDSRGTHGDGTHDDKSAKLFEIDNSTVCSIAGLGSDGGPTWQLQFATGGAVRSFREELANYAGQLSFDQKLNILAHGLARRFEDLAAERHYSGQDLTPRERDIFILLAGYDLDGSAKIGKAHIEVQGFSANVDTRSQKVGGPLLYLTAGVDDTVQARLTEPKAFPHEKELNAYALAKKKDQAASMTLDQIKDLAEYLEGEAAHTYSMVVGGPIQRAVFQGGSVTLSVPRDLNPTPKPNVFKVVTNVGVKNSAIDTIRFGSENPNALSTVYMDFKCTNSDMRLDGVILISGRFEDCNLYFDGGDFYRHPGTVVMSPGHLVFGPRAAQEAQERARKAFPELSPISYQELNMPSEMLQRYFPPPIHYPW